jgi:DNA recombination protein RmuC
MEIMLLIIICILLLIAIGLIIAFRNKSSSELPLLQNKVVELQSSLSKIETNLKEDFRINREENATIAKDNRKELNDTLIGFKGEQSQTLKTITEQSQNALKEINKTLDEKVGALITKIDDNNKVNREELAKSITDFSGSNIIQLDKINNQAKEDNKLIREAIIKAFKDFQETFDKNVNSFNELQREKFTQLEAKQTYAHRRNPIYKKNTHVQSLGQNKHLLIVVSLFVLMIQMC